MFQTGKACIAPAAFSPFIILYGLIIGKYELAAFCCQSPGIAGFQRDFLRCFLHIGIVEQYFFRTGENMFALAAAFFGDAGKNHCQFAAFCAVKESCRCSFQTTAECQCPPQTQGAFLITINLYGTILQRCCQHISVLILPCGKEALLGKRSRCHGKTGAHAFPVFIRLEIAVCFVRIPGIEAIPAVIVSPLITYAHKAAAGKITHQLTCRIPVIMHQIGSAHHHFCAGITGHIMIRFRTSRKEIRVFLCIFWNHACGKSQTIPVKVPVIFLCHFFHQLCILLLLSGCQCKDCFFLPTGRKCQRRHDHRAE